MRINKFLAQATGISRRAADAAIESGQVAVQKIQSVQNPNTADNQRPTTGQDITHDDTVIFRGRKYTLDDIETASTVTVMLNKPPGYVVSRNGQGSMTVYDLLPTEYHQLKPIGRLDKESSGLLLLTNDGALAHELTHPSRHKVKRYEATLNKPLQPLHHQMVSEYGLQLDDGLSKFQLDRLDRSKPARQVQDSPESRAHDGTNWLITMHEGRNRQIRRTFAALGYTVTRLHRVQFGGHQLDHQLNGLPLALGEYRELTTPTRSP